MVSQYPHLIDLNDYPISWWNKIIELGHDIKLHPQRYSHACVGKIMATLFYEPSTRTQMSFQSAMIRLGGNIIGFDNPSTSSVSKGESLKDTTKIVSSYSDILIIRHPQPGSAKAASLTTDCSVVNAGDGGHLHPTQTLTDLLTLYEEKGRLDNLNIGLCGDLVNGRTVHSLCKALSAYSGNTFVLVSTPNLKLPSYIKDVITASGSRYTEVDSLDEVISDLDMLYMTRIQRERFANDEEYFAEKDTYILDKKKMRKSRKDMIVMHPMPRVDEISVEVDDDERAVYFKQAENGMYVRMALIMTLLESNIPSRTLNGTVRNGVSCLSPNCITQKEHYLPKSFIGNGDTLECEYCDERILL